MRLLHTADWHLGRTLEGRSRMEEQAQFLDELTAIVEEEKVDVVLVAGDVFDTVNPPAQAEQLFYDSMARLADKGRRPVVVIAGNHDHPDRLSAAVPLAREQGITILGYPTDQPLQLPVSTTDERLCVAALAYPSESRLRTVLADRLDEKLLREKYDQAIAQLFETLAAQFSPRTVNVAMSHLYVAGGYSSDSERPIEVGGIYTVQATSLPSLSQYVALGHLHRPQEVKGAAVPARYAGSPLAYSFSEAGYAKSVTLIDVHPGQPAEVKEIPLTSGKPLVRYRAKGGMEEVWRWLEEGRDRQAWVDLEIVVQNALSMEEIQRLRKAHPGLIHIRPIFPEMEEEEKTPDYQHLSLEEQFVRFYKRQTGGAEPEEALIHLFLELLNDEGREEER